MFWNSKKAMALRLAVLGDREIFLRQPLDGLAALVLDVDFLNHQIRAYREGSPRPCGLHLRLRLRRRRRRGLLRERQQRQGRIRHPAAAHHRTSNLASHQNVSLMVVVTVRIPLTWEGHPNCGLVTMALTPVTTT